MPAASTVPILDMHIAKRPLKSKPVPGERIAHFPDHYELGVRWSPQKLLQAALESVQRVPVLAQEHDRTVRRTVVALQLVHGMRLHTLHERFQRHVCGKALSGFASEVCPVLQNVSAAARA